LIEDRSPRAGDRNPAHLHGDTPMTAQSTKTRKKRTNNVRPDDTPPTSQASLADIALSLRELVDAIRALEHAVVNLRDE
jgi:hypothetical protein